MSVKEAKLTIVEIVQQLDSEYWVGYPEHFIEQAKSGILEPLLSEILSKIDGIVTATDVHAILHNKDELELYDPETESTYTQLKEPHVHILLKFSKGATLSELSAHLGIQPQYIEKAKSGRYSYENKLAYLIHAKDSNKHQYNPKAVFTLLGEDYFSIYQKKYVDWQKGKTLKTAKNASIELPLLIENILEGKITKDDIFESKSLSSIYASNRSKVNEAFSTLGEMKSHQTIKAIENSEFKKTIFFIHGSAGTGKSKLADMVVKKLLKLAKVNGQNWSKQTAASTNIADEFNGEEVWILDDLRGYSLTGSDWLKLLDPHRISPISARYHNKMGSARVIILTSSLHPYDFFIYTKDGGREDLSQYIRRIDSLVVLGSTQSKTGCQIASPTKVFDRIVKIPSYDFSVKVSFDFTLLSDIYPEILIETLLKKVALNNQWNNISLEGFSNDDD